MKESAACGSAGAGAGDGEGNGSGRVYVDLFSALLW
jgi:hypothetical protein